MSKNESVKTRKSSKIFGIGQGLTQDDGKFLGARPPTNLQVLRCMRYEQSLTPPPGHTLDQVANRVLPRLKAKYDGTLISDKSIRRKLVNLVKKNSEVRHIPIDRRETTDLSDERKFLNETFCIWQINSATKEEDRKFIESMKTDRKASIGPVDLKHEKTERRKTKDLLSYEKRKAASENEQKKFVSKAYNIIDSDSEDQTVDEEEYMPIEQTRSKRTPVFTGTTVTIPPDILSRPKIVEIAARFHITPTAQSAFTKALIEECGGEISKVALSYATADRSRREVCEQISHEVKEKWVPPEPCGIFWDSKLVPTLTNDDEKEERLAVLAGNGDGVKFLGAARYPQGSDEYCGDIICRKSVGLCKDWKCSHLICFMVFDTTSSNTGHLTAACIAIQISLGSALLWAACRHHIGNTCIILGNFKY